MGVSQVFALDDETTLSVDLDGLTALFHHRSGMTHLVAEPVPAVLSALGEGACDLAMIEARLSAAFDFAEPDAAQREQALLSCLRELEALGLVRRLPTA